jgi:hypothetical protein
VEVLFLIYYCSIRNRGMRVVADIILCVVVGVGGKVCREIVLGHCVCTPRLGAWTRDSYDSPVVGFGTLNRRSL